jgi:hypothetical protein
LGKEGCHGNDGNVHSEKKWEIGVVMAIQKQYDKSKQIIDLLEKEYSILRNETLLDVQSVRNHVRNSQVLITTMVSVAVFVLNTPNYGLKTETATLWLLFMLFATTVTYYLLYAILESIHAMNVLGEYLASIEKRVNFLWEQKL